MILEDGRVRSIYGPKENRTRPAINPLFRSAAAAYGPRVSGVILTGMLDDGVAGLAEIKRKGGVAVIQDPATAQFPSMPQNAIKHIQSDYIAPVEEIAGIVVRLATSERIARSWEDPMERLLLENQCPECAGPLWEERQGAIVQYRCRVGHVFSPLALKEEEHDAVEKSIWASIIKLENAAALSERLISELGEEAARDGREKREQALRLKKMLMEPSTED